MKTNGDEEIIAIGAWKECETCGFKFLGEINVYRAYCDICMANLASDGTTEGEVISLLDQIGRGMLKK